MPEELPPQDAPEVEQVPDADRPDVDDEGHQDPNIRDGPNAATDRA